MLETPDKWEDRLRGKDEWRYAAAMADGAQCVIISGHPHTPKSCVDTWAMRKVVVS